MFPDAYAFCPAIRSDTATAAGSGAWVVAAGAATRGLAGAADWVAEELWRSPGASGVVACGDRPVSMIPTPPSATQPATIATVVHGTGRGGAAAWRATSGLPHRRHLTRSPRT